MLWSVAFYFLSSNSPENHRFISQEERDYILQETRKSLEVRRHCQKVPHHTRIGSKSDFVSKHFENEILIQKVPWIRILTSKACYSIFIGHFAHNWGNYLFMTQTPSFLKDVLKFDLKSVCDQRHFSLSICKAIQIKCILFVCPFRMDSFQPFRTSHTGFSIT